MNGFELWTRKGEDEKIIQFFEKIIQENARSRDLESNHKFMKQILCKN